MSDYKIEVDKNSRLLKEDAEREAFRRIFEDASHQNDVRIKHYLNNYYLPPKEKELRNNVSSEKQTINSSQRRKVGQPDQRSQRRMHYMNPPQNSSPYRDYDGGYR